MATNGPDQNTQNEEKTMSLAERLQNGRASLKKTGISLVETVKKNPHATVSAVGFLGLLAVSFGPVSGLFGASLGLVSKTVDVVAQKTAPVVLNGAEQARALATAAVTEFNRRREAAAETGMDIEEKIETLTEAANSLNEQEVPTAAQVVTTNQGAQIDNMDVDMVDDSHKIEDLGNALGKLDEELDDLSGSDSENAGDKTSVFNYSSDEETVGQRPVRQATEHTTENDGITGYKFMTPGSNAPKRTRGVLEGSQTPVKFIARMPEEQRSTSTSPEARNTLTALEPRSQSTPPANGRKRPKVNMKRNDIKLSNRKDTRFRPRKK